MSNNCSIRVFFVNGPFFTRATDNLQKSLNRSGKCLVKKDFFFFFLIESLIGSQTLLPGVPRSIDKAQAINGSFFEHFRAWSYNKCGVDTSCMVLTRISYEYPLCFGDQRHWGMQSRSCTIKSEDEYLKKVSAKTGPSMEIYESTSQNHCPLERKTNLHHNEKKRNNEEVEWEILVVLQSEYKETCSEIKWW